MPFHTNWTLFLGRLHPLLVHLPIGFLTLLAAVELAARFARFRGVAQARGIVLAATVVAAIGSVIAGLLLSTAGGYDHHLLFWHKWTGITLAAFVVTTAVAHYRHRKRAYGGLLLATLALLGPASHFGGSMTHGPDYLTAYAPAWFHSVAGAPTSRPVVTVVADPSQAHLYADLARPVLVQSCISCHGPDRASGRLRLDSLDAIARGGQSGPAATLILARLSLPPTDPKHMPPADQPQPSADQIAAVRWWASAGANNAPLADVHPTQEQTELVARLLHVAAKPAPSEEPQPLAAIAPIVAGLSAQMHVAPTGVDEPWLACSARTTFTFGDRDLSTLAPLARNITSLDLAGTAVTDAGLKTVGAMPNLRELHLERTRVTDVGLRSLAPLSKLEYLNLYGTAVTDAGLDALRPLTSLRRLYVWQSKVTNPAADAFAEARVDPTRTRELQQQIAALQARIDRQHVAIVGATRPTTTPTTQP